MFYFTNLRPFYGKCLSSIQVPPTHGSHLTKCLDSTELLEFEPVILRPSQIIPKLHHTDRQVRSNKKMVYLTECGR